MMIREIIVLAFLSIVFSSLANAAEDTILIQLAQDGQYRVWYSRGESNLTENDLTALEASALPEGGPVVLTAAGSARAFASDDTIRVEIPDASHDKTLLISRDPCGWASAWHTAGHVDLSNDDLTELVMTALPTGGKNILVGTRLAKAYTSKLGVVAVIWQPLPRRAVPDRPRVEGRK